MDEAAEILDAFAREGWASDPFERTLALAAADAEQAARLLSLAIARGGQDATFLHAAISFVKAERLPGLAREAVEAFARMAALLQLDSNLPCADGTEWD